MGARPLARVIQEQVKKPLAEEVLFGKLAKGGTVRILLKDDALHFEYLGRDEEKALPKMPERKALPRAKASQSRARSRQQPTRNPPSESRRARSADGPTD